MSVSCTPQDEQLLIDFVLGRCDEATRNQIAQRLTAEPQLAQLQRDITTTFSALDYLKAPEPPANLVERTLSRVKAQRRTEALLASRPVVRESRPAIFNFRELAALAAALVLAAGILVPVFRQEKMLQYRARCAQQMSLISTAINHYAMGNNDRLPASPAQKGEWLRPAPQAGNSAGLFSLVSSKYVQPDAFVCPATGGGQPFEVRAGMTDFPTSKAIAYSYQHSMGSPLTRGQLGNSAKQMAIMADATPAFKDGRFLPDRIDRVSENHPDSGQNVLFVAGNVAWATNSHVGVGGNNIWIAEGVYSYNGNETPTSVTDSFLLPN